MLDSTKFRFLQTLKYWKIFLFSNSNNFGKLEGEFSVTFIKMSLSGGDTKYIERLIFFLIGISSYEPLVNEFYLINTL